MFFVIGTEHSSLVKAKLANASFNLPVWEAFFYPHILLGTIALAIGPFQLTQLSRRKPKLHRNLGRVCAFTIFANVLIVPYIALFSTGGLPSTVAFLVLDVFWLWTTAMSFIRAYQKKIAEHKPWILRSYAITWVFVFFRIILIPFSIFLHPSMSFPIAVYLSIALILLFVERKRFTSKPAADSL